MICLGTTPARIIGYLRFVFCILCFNFLFLTAPSRFPSPLLIPTLYCYLAIPDTIVPFLSAFAVAKSLCLASAG